MATPSSLRRINQRKVVRALLSVGTASRADLARLTELSQPTAGKIVDDLLAASVLEDASLGVDPSSRSERPKIGRPGTMVRLNRSRTRFLAIEMGVVRTRAAYLPVAAQREDQWTHEIPTPKSPEELVTKLGKSLPRDPNMPLDAILVSMPGVVDEAGGRSLLCPNIRWMERVNISRLLRGLFDAPTVVVQENRAMALGQLALDPDGDDFLLVELGDGVGGAAVVRGRLYNGPLPLSGELGHTPIIGNPRKCGCGSTGCMETLLSQNGLIASFAEANKKAPRTWAAVKKEVEEKGIRPWLSKSLEVAGATIAGAMNVLGVRRVVMSGWINDLPEVVAHQLSSSISRGAMWGRFGEVAVDISDKHRMAGLVWAGLDRVMFPVTDESMARNNGGAVAEDATALA
ncbi:MAG: ROK family protein [Phycisphaerales bacterium]|nr:ROK family protein [Phycisphaerales bacterium]